MNQLQNNSADIFEKTTDSDNKVSGGCCPVFHPEKWDNQTYHWDNKKFIKASVPTIFHIPFPPMIGKKITKMMRMAEGSHCLDENMEDVLLLFTDPHPFRSEMYLSVTSNVPEAYNTKLSGTFQSKVFEGSYNSIPKFIKEMNLTLLKEEKNANKYYVHYAYCPRCAKEAGHNYIVLFAEIQKDGTNNIAYNQSENILVTMPKNIIS